MTIFDKIISREIPATIVYEDDLCLAFNDIAPQAPIHIVLIPKKPIVSLAQVSNEDQSLMGHLLIKAAEIANSLGVSQDGYRLVTNVGTNGGQSVFHIHFHILGGRKLNWPPG